MITICDDRESRAAHAGQPGRSGQNSADVAHSEFGVLRRAAWRVSKRDLRIDASLIGRDVQVTHSQRVPRTNRLVLGDHSKVQISS
jgi:hypothetical protein